MPRVLVVDDDADIRAVLREALEQEGHAVDEAEDGAEALARMDAACPDAVLLDLAMPGMDGFAFARAARAHRCDHALPIVVMSAAYDLRAAAAQLRPLGVRACVAKPFDLVAMLGAIGRLAGR